MFSENQNQGSGQGGENKFNMDEMKKDLKMPEFSTKGINWKDEVMKVVNLFKGNGAGAADILRNGHFSVAVVFVLLASIAMPLGMFISLTGYFQPPFMYVVVASLVYFVSEVAALIGAGVGGLVGAPMLLRTTKNLFKDVGLGQNGRSVADDILNM